EYKKGWRELEQSFTAGLWSLDEIRQRLGPCTPTSCTDITGFFDSLHNRLRLLLDDPCNNKGQPVNKIVGLLKKKDFFKKWLWYTRGFLFMNPVIATTPERRYPSQEKISQLNDSNKKFLLNDTTENALLKTIFETRKIRNEVLIPTKQQSEETSLFFYNAAEKYKCINKMALPKYKDDKVALGVVIYNVPAKETLKISLAKSAKIKDQGPLANIIEETDLFTTLDKTKDIITQWANSSVKASLNGFQALPPAKVITVPSTSDVSVTSLNVGAKGFADFQKNQQVNWEIAMAEQTYKTVMSDERLKNDTSMKANVDLYHSLFEKINQNTEELIPANEEFKVIIKGREIAATKNSDADKLIFIYASFRENDTVACNSCPPPIAKCLIDTFLQRDYCYHLNYKHKDSLEKSTELFLQRFQCYTKVIKDCDSILRQWHAVIKDDLSQLKDYLSIIQRSLPPVIKDDPDNSGFFTVETINKAADYRTVFFTPDLGDPPQKIIYEVTSNQSGNVIDGKNIDSPNVVISHSFKFAKRHYIDFSLGLAYTLKEYLVSNQSSNTALPEISEGDRFRPIVGMHIYPAGLLKVDKPFRLDPSRLSIFLGASLAKALDNLYTGLSYDVVPGLRAMAGWHFYKDTRYTISNNQVIDKASSFRNSGLFVSLNMEPVTFIKIFTVLK
ncbi:MAG TPA: hypothetical protein VK796_03405, partial [Cytophaga sp.]|nr:hypothetical protein [Cytophaga sp.]